MAEAMEIDDDQMGNKNYDVVSFVLVYVHFRFISEHREQCNFDFCKSF